MSFTKPTSLLGNSLFNYAISGDFRTAVAPLILPYEDIGQTKIFFTRFLSHSIANFLPYRTRRVALNTYYLPAINIAVYYVAMRIFLRSGPISVTKNLMFAQIAANLVIKTYSPRACYLQNTRTFTNTLISGLAGRFFFSPYQNADHIFAANLCAKHLLSHEIAQELNDDILNIAEAVLAATSVYFLGNITITTSLVNTWALSEISALALKTILNQVNPPQRY